MEGMRGDQIINHLQMTSYSEGGRRSLLFEAFKMKLFNDFLLTDNILFSEKKVVSWFSRTLSGWLEKAEKDFSSPGFPPMYGIRGMKRIPALTETGNSLNREPSSHHVIRTQFRL